MNKGSDIPIIVSMVIIGVPLGIFYYKHGLLNLGGFIYNWEALQADVDKIDMILLAISAIGGMSFIWIIISRFG